MIIADTSVWIDHLRKGNDYLRALLHNTQVAIHPFVIGELQCGHLKNRKVILSLLADLPCVDVAEHHEVSFLIEEKKLYGKGLGWIDAHLICSSLFSHLPIWTFDTRMRNVCKYLKIAYFP